MPIHHRPLHPPAERVALAGEADGGRADAGEGGNGFTLPPTLLEDGFSKLILFIII